MNRVKYPSPTDTPIKVYRDMYCKSESALVRFKGKTDLARGVIFCKRPSKLRILIQVLKSLFRKKIADDFTDLHATDLHAKTEAKETSNEQ